MRVGWYDNRYLDENVKQGEEWLDNDVYQEFDTEPRELPETPEHAAHGEPHNIARTAREQLKVINYA